MTLTNLSSLQAQGFKVERPAQTLAAYPTKQLATSQVPYAAGSLCELNRPGSTHRRSSHARGSGAGPRLRPLAQRPRAQAHPSNLTSTAARDNAPAPSNASDSVTWAWRVGLATEVARFAGPALGIPLADPLMSLVDSVAVAQVAGSDQLASLGPNSLIFSFATYIFSALSIATISVMTEQLQQDNKEGASRVLSTALAAALLGGCVVLIVLQVWGRQLLAATGCAPKLLSPAWEYLRIRAFAMPASLMLMITQIVDYHPVTRIRQAGLLAQRDSVLPFLAVMLQLSANVAGDYWLVVLLKQGVAGAAWATVFSQLLGTSMLILALQTSAKVKLYLGLPRWREFRLLAATFGPTTFIYLCKNLCYLMVQGAATRLPALQLAAHQGAWSVWALISFVHTPLEQAALAFIPAHAASSKRRRGTVGVIMGMSIILGCFTATLCGCTLTFLKQLLTPDTRLWPYMQDIAPQATLAIVFCSLDVAATGVLIASKRLALLVRAMATTMAIMLMYYQIWKPAGGHSLGAVWWGLVIFFGGRVTQSVVGMARMYLNPANTQTNSTDARAAASST